MDYENRRSFNRCGNYGSENRDILNRHGNYNFQFCNSADRREHCKSGVPDNERDEVSGVPVRKGPSFADENVEVLGDAARIGRKVQDGTFEVLGAKTFRVLGSVLCFARVRCSFVRHLTCSA